MTPDWPEEGLLACSVDDCLSTIGAAQDPESHRAAYIKPIVSVALGKLSFAR